MFLVLGLPDGASFAVPPPHSLRFLTTIEPNMPYLTWVAGFLKKQRFFKENSVLPSPNKEKQVVARLAMDYQYALFDLGGWFS